LLATRTTHQTPFADRHSSHRADERAALVTETVQALKSANVRTTRLPTSLREDGRRQNAQAERCD